MNPLERELQEIIGSLDRRWRLRRIEPLPGRASILHISTCGGKAKRLILLSHGQADRDRNPRIAHDEFRVLKTVSAAGLPVADALYLNEAPQSSFLITAFVEGLSQFSAEPLPEFCRRLAAILNDIHSVSLSQYDLSFLSQPLNEESGSRDFLSGALETLAGRSTSGRSERRRLHAGLRRAWPRVESNAPVLLHGDFWLGNLLWRGAELSAIIDWEDAMLGDPLADLGKSRLEILWALGEEAMRLYTEHYFRLNPQLQPATLPFWDLWGAARLSHFPSFAAAPTQIPQMRAGYEAFIKEAIRRLDTI